MQQYLQCRRRIHAVVFADVVELRCRDCSKDASTDEMKRVVTHRWAYADGAWVQLPDTITTGRGEPQPPHR